MKHLIFLFLFLTTVSYGQDAIFFGKIGKYPIEVVLEKSNYETGELKGKYRYMHKEKYLQLKGQVLESCIFLEEFYREELTGTFYLEKEDTTLKGKWIGGTTSFDVVFDLTPLALDKIDYKSVQEFNKETSAEISGTYKQSIYFLNDMWFRPEKPNMEIGFNGGTLVMERIGDNRLHFLAKVICGPTYHMAYASGVALAQKEGVYKYSFVEETDTCTIYIELGEKSAHVWAESSNSFTCGFGARAYLDHHFLKVNEEVLFEEEY